MKNKEEKGKIDQEEVFTAVGWDYRQKQCLIMFGVLTAAYAMRSCMGVSLVAMTDVPETEVNLEANDTNEFKTEGILHSLMLVPPYPSFNWTKQSQDTVLSSFFWGYVVLQLPAGHLAHKYGAKYLLVGTMIINCVVSIMMPIASFYGGYYFTIACRVLQGLSQACIMPGIHTFLGKWVPLRERGRLAAFVYGGQVLGTVFGLPLTGFISSSPMGWPGIFRFYGIVSGIFGVLIWCLIHDTPAKHPNISAAEQNYIEADVGGDELKKIAVPWLKILKHPGVYAIIIAHVGNTWGTVTLYSEIPAYMDKILKVNIKSNGLLSALPFLASWIANFFFSWFTDYLIIKNICSVTNVRKIANSLGNVPAAIGLIVLAFAPQNIYIVETILVVLCAFQIGSHCGFQVNHMDISPNFAGTMMSISNFVSNLGSATAPLVYGFILTDVTDQYLWRQVFFVAAGFFLVANLLYVIFGTAERAEWNEPSHENKDVEEKLLMMQKLKLKE